MPKIHVNIYNEYDHQKGNPVVGIPFIGNLLAYQTPLNDDNTNEYIDDEGNTVILDEKHYHLAVWYCIVFGVAIAFVLAFALVFKFQYTAALHSNNNNNNSLHQCTSIAVDHWNSLTNTATRKHM